MDAMAREEVERLMFVEQTKEQALEEFRQNPSEPSVCVLIHVLL